MTTDAASGDYLSAHLRRAKEGLGYTRSAYADKAWRTFGHRLPTNTRAAVLEVGPGECELAELLVAHGYTGVEVVDSSAEVIDQARALGITATHTADTVEFLRGRREDFEAVLLLHVLEHVPKAEVIPFLGALRRALRPNGRLLLEVPNMGDPLNGTYFRYADFTHEVGFTEESLHYVLGQSGFSRIEFLPRTGANRRVARTGQKAAHALLHALLFVVNLPNGRQMRRRIGPVLSVSAQV